MRSDLSQGRTSRGRAGFASRGITIARSGRRASRSHREDCNAGTRNHDRGGGVSPKVPVDRSMEARQHDREGRLLDALHRAALFCDQKIGWNRIGVVLSVTLIAIAGVALYRILRTINAAEVVEALVTTDWRDIALAALFVAGGYFTLTFYDLFALRTIGRT